MPHTTDSNQAINFPRPLLVTGAHRSGTTWVGKMLAAGGGFTYVSEPLNIWHRPGVLAAPSRYWYQYVCADNEDYFLPAFYDTLQLRYRLAPELLSLRSLRDVGRLLRDYPAFLRGRLAGWRPLLKDPFAVFSAAWFAQRLGAQVVVVVRHPAAFASSLKRLGWTFNFRQLLDQPLLMRDWLEPYRDEMEAANRQPDDLINRAGLLWRLIYQVVDQLHRQHSDFVVVRHEDLSRQPLEQFGQLYADLGLDYSQAAQAAIRRATSAGNPEEGSIERKYSVHLDSRANLQNWKKRLDANEIERLQRLTADVSKLYYQPEDWQ